jgi:hypothetical protein
VDREAASAVGLELLQEIGMAATNKCLAQMNKSRTAAKATKQQDRQ